jgi:thymidylate synthase (FAD)
VQDVSCFMSNNKVELIGTYGNDELICCAAWTSTSRELTDEKKNPDRQEKLLTMLASEHHETPFERGVVHFLVTCDTASHIHLLKHRIGVSANGESARYRELKDKALVPHDWPEEMQKILADHNQQCFNLYHAAIKNLVGNGYSRKRAKESARFFLPYANQLTLDIMMNLRAFFHFQKLRNSEHAQLEIREIAQQMLDLVRKEGSFDLSLKAFGY